MARVILAALARSASIDQFGNQLSIFEIVDNLQVGTDDPAGLEALAGGGPVPIPGFNMCFVTVLVRSDNNVSERPKMRVVLKMPSGKEHVGPETDVDLETARVSRNVGRIGALPVSGTGPYSFEVQMLAGSAWDVAASYPFVVEAAPPSVVTEPAISEARN